MLISAIRSKVALQKEPGFTPSAHTSEIRINHHLRKMSANLPNAVIMISELLIIKAKLIHKVSCHLLDLVV